MIQRNGINGFDTHVLHLRRCKNNNMKSAGKRR